MAILRMKKVALIAHTDNRSAVLQSLQDIGAVEVVSTQEQELNAVEASGTLPALEKRLAERNHAVIAVAEGAGQDLRTKD